MNKVLQKINEVYKAIMALQADAKVQYKSISYSYLSDAKIVTELHKAFAEQGLIMTQNKIEIIENNKHGAGRDVILQVDFDIFDAETGEHITITAIGQGIDSGDKAFYKAMTGARKYALRLAFMLATSDDPDAVASDELAEKTKTQGWNMAKIKRIIKPELRQLFAQRKTSAAKIVEFFENFDGDQQAILDFLKGGEDELD